MAGKGKRGGDRGSRQRRLADYEPARRPKLVGPATLEPPPVPVRALEEDGRFGEADEDGLRMLAALETLPSLEPDFVDDVDAEAAVTIVEQAPLSSAEPDEDDGARRGSLRARLGGVEPAPEIEADTYAAYQGPIEEAVVEIVETGGRPSAPRATPVAPRQQARMRRFFKALTGRGS